MLKMAFHLFWLKFYLCISCVQPGIQLSNGGSQVKKVSYGCYSRDRGCLDGCLPYR